MKPWFEKEAEIIPFPKKPERQVIKMPSVSEYPDFITGVLDLQARRDKEQISKDSYNRLYQDLIHRFMKKESFENPWFLRELAPDLAKKRVLAQLAKKAEDDPIFQKIYKDMIVGTPVQTRIEDYIMARKDRDAINNIAYLVKQIPSLTSKISELKTFLAQMKNPKFDFIELKSLIPKGGMTAPAELVNVVTDPLAKELFSRMEKDLVGAKLIKGDKSVSAAGPGEGSLAILSPNITFAPDEAPGEQGGDIRIKGSKIEVKGYNGVLRGVPVDQSSVVNFLNTQKGKFKLNTRGQTIRANDMAIPKGTKFRGGGELREDFDSEGFIDAVTQAWFGATDSNLKGSLHTPNFMNAWYDANYNFYAKEAGHAGILFLSNKSGRFAYCKNGAQVLALAQGQGVKQDSGSLFGGKVKQNPRELGIRIGII